MKRKLFILLLAVVANTGTMFALNGTCGDNLTWDLTNDTLVISGTGAMTDYTYGSPAPWYSQRSSIVSVQITSGVTGIGDLAFYGCPMTSVHMPNTLMGIGNRAFLNCTNLNQVNIPDSVTTIGDSGFYGCSGLTSLTIGNSVKSIGYTAFANCSALTSVTIPNSVTTIGSSAFQGCSGLDSLTIGTGLTRLQEQTFYQCGALTTVTINSNAVANQSFVYSLFGTQVKRYIIGDDVQTIGYGTFMNCDSLTTVMIGAGVTRIGQIAFSGCTALSSVTCLPLTPPSMETGVFGQTDCSQIPLYVPKAAMSAYRAADQWKDFEIKSIEGTWSVTFLDWDSTTLLVLEIPEDSLPVYAGDTPTRPNDEQYTYTFINWTPEIMPAAGDTTYIATYRRDSISYTVSSNSANGTVDGVGEYLLGTEVKLTAIPDEGYIFVGWSDDVKENPRSFYLTCDTVFTAIFFPAINAGTVETTDVMVTSDDNTANLVWPAVSGAASYELTIKDESGNIFCTLVFNADGEMVSMAFNAPRREAVQHTRSAGFSFTVTDLEEGETYDVTITAKDENGNSLDIKVLSFVAGGGEQQDMESVSLSGKKIHKFFRNGQILILYGDRIYTLQGTGVK